MDNLHCSLLMTRDLPSKCLFSPANRHPDPQAFVTAPKKIGLTLIVICEYIHCSVIHLIKGLGS